MMTLLNHWFRSWLGICLLRRSPQDDPRSYTGLTLALLLYAVTDILVAGGGSGWWAALGMTAIDVLVMVLLTAALLSLSGKSVRLMQTLTALAGAGGLLGLLALPAVRQSASYTTDDQLPTLLVVFWLVLMVWSIVVRAHIYRHALSINYALATAVAILQAFLVFRLVGRLFPETGA